MMRSPTGPSFLRSLLPALKSTAGMIILVAVAAAALAAMDKGFYIIVNTVITGGMWALMSIGLALVFGVMNIPNFAHGEFFMVGTLASYFAFTALNGAAARNPNVLLTALTPFLSIFAALFAGAIVGVLTDKLVFYPLRKRSREGWVMNTFLLTVGLSTVLINGHQLIFGTEFKGIVRYWNVPAVSFFGVNVSWERLIAFLFAMVSIAVFSLFMKFSKIGRAIRAVSQDESGALLVGIDLNMIQVLTMALSCGLAALAGGSLLFIFPSSPTVGKIPLLMAWYCIILVGMGNVGGSMVGAFIVALLQVLSRAYMGEGWDIVITPLLIIPILIFKPAGIFGSEVRSLHEM